MRPFILKAQSKISGLSLVEVLIAMALMSLLMLSVNMTVNGLATNAKSLGMRNRASMEIFTLITQMRDDIQNAVRIDNNSFSNRLVLHLLDSNGVDYLKGYKIETISGKNYLRVGTNLTDANDVTASKWSSPYIVSDYTAYELTGGQFLYCGREYNCTRLVDTNANGVWDGSATDSSTVPSPYTALDNSSLTWSPRAATRVVLSGFVFDAKKGNPPVKISVPELFVRPKRLEWTTVPAEYYPFLIGTITGNDNNDLPMGGWSGWQAQSVCYDSYYDRALIVGAPPNTTVKNRIFSVSGWGFPVNYTLIPTPTLVNKTFNSVTVTPDGYKILLLESAGDSVYVVANPTLSGGLDLANKAADPDNGNNTSVMSASYSTLTLSGFLATTTAKAIAFTPKFTTSTNPDGDFYVVSQPSGGGAYRLYRRKLSTGGAGDNSTYPNDYPLPAGLTNPTSMFVEPVTGMPYIVDGTVYTSGSDKMINIYKIDVTNTTTSTNTSTMPINLTAINSGWAWATGQFSVGYDYRTNHLYLLNPLQRNLHRIVPDRTITPLQ